MRRAWASCAPSPRPTRATWPACTAPPAHSRIDWPDNLPYSRLVPTLVSRIPEHAAFLNEATTLFRGAGYVAFGMPGPDGAVVPPPENTRHAAIAADYAHVTAPLRRLVDRYATEVCLAISAGTPGPAVGA